MKRLTGWIAGIVLISACSSPEPKQEAQEKPGKLFELREADQTGLTFSNDIVETQELNYYTFPHVYMGAGVATGDLNNDGLQDLVFTGNVVQSAIYLNKGDLKFEDITASSGINTIPGFSAGVTLADVNQDGFLDIYVSRSGWFKDPEILANHLYINNGDATFTESAEEYGLADANHSIQSSFFDYDNDGDLDVYIANTPVNFDLTFALVPRDRINEENFPGIGSGDKLYRNDNGKFTDVSKEAGIPFDIGFGLQVTTTDLTNDGFPDIYVCNDFLHPDFFYVNNGDGTFTEASHERMKHISFYSMGADAADINNDGLQDFIALDMMAEDNYRQKTTMASMDIQGFWNMVNAGYHYQYMHNVLQLNNGDGTFSEIGQLAGIDKTDWSWTALAADYDNDGYKDLFVTNGVKRDVTNKDAQKAEAIDVESGRKIPLEEALAGMPSNKLKNVIYQNKGDLSFAKMNFEWGIDKASFSNGAVYADLDNDGDLDLVTNNVDESAYLYENKGNENNYLKVALEGNAPNRNGIGARVYVYSNGEVQFFENFTTRGYMSGSVGPLHFGLGGHAIDKVKVVWNSGNEQVVNNVQPNQVLTLKEADATPAKGTGPAPKTLFTETTIEGLDFEHVENYYDDYLKEVLLPHKMSQFGPNFAAGDVNGDGQTDLFFGGAIGQAGALYLGSGNGFERTSGPWDADKGLEDIGTVFFDADNDGDQDLYVVSGGNEFAPQTVQLQDRLYINDNGTFSKSATALPVMRASGSCVVPGDYDADGDLDLFVGGRVVPGNYPFPARAYVLRNDAGTFKDVTKTVAPDLVAPGLVTSAVWSDHDGDNDLDLIVVGEWMPLSVYRNDNGNFTNATEELGLSNTRGWWNKIIEADFDGDGDMDYVAGNYGLNSKFDVSVEEPLHVYCNDFDRSGTYDIVLGYYNDGTCWPVRGRQCSSDQMPMIKKKYKTYHDFGVATLEDIYGEDLENSLHYEAQTFAHTYMENTGDGFKLTELPIAAQISTVYGLVAHDMDGDGTLDLLVSGNFYGPEVETGRQDAGIGLFLHGNGDGTFDPVNGKDSGFNAPYDAKDMTLIETAAGVFVIIANNNSAVQVFKLEPTSSPMAVVE